MSFEERAIGRDVLDNSYDWRSADAGDSRLVGPEMAPRSGFYAISEAPDVDTTSDGRDLLASITPSKRIFDLLFAVVMIVSALPVMIIIALVIKIVAPGPVLFCQTRVGQNGRSFTCLKFRTMVVDADERLKRLLEQDGEARREWEQDQKLRNDPRITRFGNLLRSSSLDELPQLFNILAGQMSVVGPRPIVPDEIERYGVDIEHYYAVRPGLTGLWQTSGRNDTSYSERVRLDVEYARNISLARDLSICLKTVPAMITARGCY